ncbi:hypothetical protein Hypma_009259 [Hypsizygus marmoreus]|uniref:RING-type domain-containing protein n=1 Tax=Hypsizygus marmoreus TaxID=39966 RepID=A0A369JQU4_HYPMA|nr:hypothetical protein Hypma_009259 [Hypsizygus marmoreus]
MASERMWTQEPSEASLLLAFISLFLLSFLMVQCPALHVKITLMSLYSHRGILVTRHTLYVLPFTDPRIQRSSNSSQPTSTSKDLEIKASLADDQDQHKIIIACSEERVQQHALTGLDRFNLCVYRYPDSPQSSQPIAKQGKAPVKARHTSPCNITVFALAQESYTDILGRVMDVGVTDLLVVIAAVLFKCTSAFLKHFINIAFKPRPTTSLESGHTVTIKTSAMSVEANESPTDHIECGCCFAAYPFEQMVQCSEMHLFCFSCMKTHASVLLGAQNPNIQCVDQSGCTAVIPSCQLRRFLSEKMMNAWERVSQRHELDSAGLQGLEDCPFCEWACIIEGETITVFECGNKEECGVVSCRWCKKVDHRPRSCEDVIDLKGRHSIDEAMSCALMRNCPKCRKPFIKETGCNRMTCPTVNCRTVICYACRKAIGSAGYSHFNLLPAEQPCSSTSADLGKCLLWDNVEQRHEEDVKQAAERALKEYHLARTKPAANRPNCGPSGPGHHPSQRADSDGRRKPSSSMFSSVRAFFLRRVSSTRQSRPI